MTPVCHGATLRCTCGVTTSTLMVPNRGIGYEKIFGAAIIIDCVPLVNIPPFGACTSPTNPQPAVGVGKACVPVFATPWATEAFGILLCGLPVLDDSSVLLCAYGGVVRIEKPGQDIATHTPFSLQGGS